MCFFVANLLLICTKLINCQGYWDCMSTLTCAVVYCRHESVNTLGQVNLTFGEKGTGLSLCLWSQNRPFGGAFEAFKSFIFVCFLSYFLPNLSLPQLFLQKSRLLSNLARLSPQIDEKSQLRADVIASSLVIQLPRYEKKQSY